jgi:hypothetical protein
MSDMALAKVAFSTILAVGSVLFAVHARKKSWETKALRLAVVSIIPIKIILCLVIYIFLPQLNVSSDALQVYLPETLKLLSGEIPYIDFLSSYSPLFSVVLAIPVAIWPSVGAIVLTMLLAETAMILIYLRRQKGSPSIDSWRVAFLYLFSPISFYWIGIGGYNGALIALFTMIALVQAAKRNHLMSGIAWAVGLLVTKLLALLTWPAVIIYDRRHLLRRSLPMAIALILLLALIPFGFDSLIPVKREFGRITEGNLFFIISLAFPGIRGSSIAEAIPVAAFAGCFLVVTVRFAVDRVVDNEIKFNRASAFVALVSLLFMIFSTKSYSFYIPMFLPFLIHPLIVKGHYSGRFLGPLAILGSITTIETGSYLIDASTRAYMSGSSALTVIYVALNLITIACYILLLMECYKAALKGKSQRADSDESGTEIRRS